MGMSGSCCVGTVEAALKGMSSNFPETLIRTGMKAELHHLSQIHTQKRHCLLFLFLVDPSGMFVGSFCACAVRTQPKCYVVKAETEFVRFSDMKLKEVCQAQLREALQQEV